METFIFYYLSKTTKTYLNVLRGHIDWHFKKSDLNNYVCKSLWKDKRWEKLENKFSFARLWPCKTLPGYIVRKSPINTMSSLMGRGGGTRDNRLRFDKIATPYFDGFWRKYKIFCPHLNLDPLPSIGSLQTNIAVASKYNFPLFSKYNLLQIDISQYIKICTIYDFFGSMIWNFIQNFDQSWISWYCNNHDIGKLCEGMQSMHYG